MVDMITEPSQLERDPALKKFYTGKFQKHFYFPVFNKFFRENSKRLQYILSRSVSFYLFDYKIKAKKPSKSSFIILSKLVNQFSWKKCEYQQICVELKTRNF